MGIRGPLDRHRPGLLGAWPGQALIPFWGSPGARAAALLGPEGGGEEPWALGQCGSPGLLEEEVILLVHPGQEVQAPAQLGRPHSISGRGWRLHSLGIAASFLPGAWNERDSGCCPPHPQLAGRGLLCIHGSRSYSGAALGGGSGSLPHPKNYQEWTGVAAFSIPRGPHFTSNSGSSN